MTRVPGAQTTKDSPTIVHDGRPRTGNRCGHSILSGDAALWFRVADALHGRPPQKQPATAHQGRRHMRTCSRPVCRPPQSFHTRNGVLAAERIQEVLVFSVQRSVREQKTNHIRSKVPLCGSATECVGHGPISITEREKSCNQGGSGR